MGGNKNYEGLKSSIFQNITPTMISLIWQRKFSALFNLFQ